MNRFSRPLLARLMCIAPMLLTLPNSLAQVPTNAAQAPNENDESSLKQVGDYSVETVTTSTGVSVFIYDAGGNLLHGRLGQLTVQFKDGKRYRYNLSPTEEGSLKASIDFSKRVGQQAKLDFKLSGKQSTRKHLSYQDVCTIPLSKSQLAAAAIARQKVCPVTGQKLGSMGEPIAVSIEGREIYVCCRGCISSLKSEPTKFLSGRPEIVVSDSTKADADLIAKQARCPVMDQPLGSMGNPVKVLVGEKPVFLCCKGCLRKIKANPEKYVAMVHSAPKPTIK